MALYPQAELASDQFIQDHQKIARPFQDFRWTENGGESWGHLKITAVPSNAASELHNHRSCARCYAIHSSGMVLRKI